MPRDTTIRELATTLTIAALLLGPGRAAAAEDAPANAPAAGERIEAPSGYVESIETPGTEGGVMDEADAAKAQAEAAKAEAAKAKAKPSPQQRTAAGIVTDLIIARPTALMATIAGSAYFALTLPITAPTGQYDEALDRFVKEPADRLTAPVAE